jgi:hypothetical protein
MVKAKRKSLSLVVVAMLLVCALILPTYAAYIACYEDDSTSQASLIVLASIQGHTNSSGNRFIRVYATNRFDPVEGLTPICNYLMMSINVTGLANGQSLYKSEMVSLSDYMFVGSNIDENDNVSYLYGSYTAYFPNSSISFNIPNTSITCWD